MITSLSSQSSPDEGSVHVPVTALSWPRSYMATGHSHGGDQANGTSDYVRETDPGSYGEPFPDRSSMAQLQRPKSKLVEMDGCRATHYDAHFLHQASLRL